MLSYLLGNELWSALHQLRRLQATPKDHYILEHIKLSKLKVYLNVFRGAWYQTS